MYPPVTQFETVIRRARAEVVLAEGRREARAQNRRPRPHRSLLLALGLRPAPAPCGRRPC